MRASDGRAHRCLGVAYGVDAQAEEARSCQIKARHLGTPTAEFDFDPATEKEADSQPL